MRPHVDLQPEVCEHLAYVVFRPRDAASLLLVPLDSLVSLPSSHFFTRLTLFHTADVSPSRLSEGLASTSRPPDSLQFGSGALPIAVTVLHFICIFAYFLFG